MNTRKQTVWICLLLILTIYRSVPKGHAYEIPTHEQLSETALIRSNLDEYVRGWLSFCWYLPSGEQTCWGFPQGIDQPFFNEKSVRALIKEGAANEDKPAFRSRHHFHNPRKAWNQAGLISCPGCESSIVWGQDTQQWIGGKHSWQDARNSFFEAVTATTVEDRNRNLADTFKSLGHLIHLVQDAANPAHTRDDWHPIRDDLHLWAAANASGIIAGIGGLGQDDWPLPPFDISLFDQSTTNDYAPIPIARVIDATDGDRGTLSTGYNIGIGEYSNANFFSDDTVFSQAFLFPGSSNLEPLVDPVTNETYLKFTSSSGGETDYKVAHASALPSI